MTAATRQPIGIIHDVAPAWELFRQILGEAAAVGRSEGVALPADLVDRQLTLASGLAPTLYSSLYDDLVTGRRIELDALLGELIRRAARVAVAAPAARAVYAIVLAQAKGQSEPTERRGSRAEHPARVNEYLRHRRTSVSP